MPRGPAPVDFPALFAAWERALDARQPVFDMRVYLADCSRPDSRDQNLTSLEKLRRGRGKTPWPEFYWGLVHGGGRGLRALDCVERYSESRYGWLRTLSGYAHLRHHNFAEAVARFEKGLACEPRDWRSGFHLAEALLCLRRENDALKAVDGAVAAATKIDRGAALAWRGKIFLWLSRWEQAENELDAARRTGYGGGLIWSGAAAFKLGRAEKALAYFDEALKAAPSQEALVWRGELRRMQGRPLEALEDLARAPGSLWAAVNRALAKAALGDDAGMQVDFWTIPLHVVAYLKSELGVPAERPLRREERVKILEEALVRAGGYRVDEHDQAVWLPWGVRPEARSNEAAAAALIL